MDVAHFCATFEEHFPAPGRNRPTRRYSLNLKVKIGKRKERYYLMDPLRDVDGMLSVKKQKLLKMAYAHLPADQAYLEIGTWLGKSLIAAMHGNPPRPTFACDNFSEYDTSKGQRVLHQTFMKNLQRYQLAQHVTFYDEPFQQIFTKEKLPVPIGVYFYDAAHDEQSQYEGIKFAKPFLAEEAIVLVDDWRFAEDSQSYAKAGTERAVAESRHEWTLLYELPARYNGDRAMWWNGLAVYRFRRR